MHDHDNPLVQFSTEPQDLKLASVQFSAAGAVWSAGIEWMR